MSKPSPSFEGILDQYFESELADDPIAANYAGLPDGEGRLGHNHPQQSVRQQKRRVRTLNQLNAINPAGLSREQHLDRLALQSSLVHECEDFERGRTGLEPDAIDDVLNLLFHELQRGDDQPRRAARNIRSVLKQVPRYLQESTELIDQPETVWLKVMQETAEGAPTLFQAVKMFLIANQMSDRDATLIRDAERAVSAYRDHACSRPTAPTGSFAIGEECVQRRLRDELGLDYNLGQVESLAKSEVARISELLQQACARINPKATAAELLKQAQSEWNPPGDLFSVYESETRRIATAFRQSGALSFPKGESLVLRPVPDFMKPLLPTAAYSSPGPFEKRQRGVFWVNDMSLGKTGEKEKRIERQQHFGIPLTCAHEAYPGHHLQFVYANQHPRKWRRMFAHAVFYEGWTLWCEQMTVDLRIDRSPWTHLQQLSDALWRCHRILIDLRLQTGRYTYQQGVNHLRRHLGFSKARAEAEINWYTGSPCVPMSYWLGRLENQRLHDRLVRGRGWSLKRFNDWLLSFGTLPQAWIERYGLE